MLRFIFFLFKKTLLIALLSYFFIGCGSEKIPKTQSGTREELSTAPPKEGFVAQCNGFHSAKNSMTGLLTSYVSPHTGTYDFSKINLRFIHLPREIFNSMDYKIEMYLWSEGNGSPILTRKTPVEFYIQNRYRGHFILNDQGAPKKFTEISLGYLNTIIENYSDPDNYNLDNFLQKHNFLLVDLPTQYSAIVLALYPSQGGDAIKYVNFLLPPFYSHPEVFMSHVESENLRSIHPNMELLSSHFSEETYYSLTEEYCKDFMRESSLIYAKNTTNSRNIASVKENNFHFLSWIHDTYLSVRRLLYNLFGLKVFPVPVSPHK